MKIFGRLAIILISILIYSPSRSQWAPCQGIEGGTTESITYQDSSLFIVGHGGIFKRQVDDPSWDSACLVYNVAKVRSTGNALFTYGGNIMSNFFRSLDNGITWEDMSWLPYGYYDMETIDSVIFLEAGKARKTRCYFFGQWRNMDRNPPLVNSGECCWNIYSTGNFFLLS